MDSALANDRPEAGRSRSVEVEILRLEDIRVAALIAKDYPTLEALMVPDCIFVESDGSVRDTRAFIANLKGGASIIDSFVIDENRVRVFGEIAVVTGRYHNAIRTNGILQPVKHARHTRVWRQQDERWRLISHQATAITPPASAQ